MSESLALIELDLSKRSVAFTALAQMRLTDALDLAAMVAVVETPEQNESAVAVQRDLKTLLSDMEKARKACKEPVIAFGKAIDSGKDSFCLPLDKELMRVSARIGDFAAVQEAKRKAADAARLLEQQKLERERQAELNRIAAEESAKRRDIQEAERKARVAIAEATSLKQREEAERLGAEAERQKQLADASTIERMTAVNESFAAQAADLPVFVPERAAGQIVKEIVVIDQIRELELVRSRPDLIRKVEFDIITIKNELGRGLKIAGVTHHMETQATVSLGRKTATLELSR